MERKTPPPREELKNYRKVYRVSSLCVVCRACMAACPAGCIDWGIDRYTIDEKLCRGCGTCAAICPAGAPEPVWVERE